MTFWFGIVKFEPPVLERAYHALGSTPTGLFPLRYEATAPTNRGPAAGQIEGFAFYNEYPDVRVLR